MHQPLKTPLRASYAAKSANQVRRAADQARKEASAAREETARLAGQLTACQEQNAAILARLTPPATDEKPATRKK